ncbi:MULTISPECIES: bifunctional folylpolyglutamate synthase/dihydrofolate synthase [Paenibacillus]|uniref:tetrahydrofolate synthase n=1 Tax=Paenibacillus aceti TaxID=1820010 RepID=A0ABQ1W9G4_9BACL|nr:MULTISPECIES: folylpolyglutamate synthase/dihydrofolate synthase family protein [Paenibacillus]GGG20261.1 bifunctional folylpolyglutamate synthase/dihydrofolate synthase [Paenibacillus aceti]
MSYKSILNYISLFNRNDKKQNLQYMQKLLEEMGDPHKYIKYIHVAGTNGKGSVVSYIGSVLAESGYITGIYTSPHIERWTERFKIGNQEISEEEFIAVAELVKQKVIELMQSGAGEPTMFEFLTAMAFQFFKDKNCDFVVLETGMGGEVDPTNIVESTIVSVITKISLDHNSYLGDTIENVAAKKAGIIKQGIKTVLYPQDISVEKVVEKVASRLKSRVHKPNFDQIIVNEKYIDKQIFSYKNYQNIEVSLLGKHQIENAVVALETLELLNNMGIDISEENIKKGISKVSWPGRTEVLNTDPLFILDGAHNLDGIKVLINSLKEYFPDKKLICIYAGLEGKDNNEMIKLVSQEAQVIYFIDHNHPRAIPSKELLQTGLKYSQNVKACNSIEEAIKESISGIGPDSYVCVAGSVFYIKEFRDYFSKKYTETL